MVTQVLAKVGALFFILAVGAVARLRKVISEEAIDTLCRIVLGVTLPFLFIYILTTRCNKNALLSLWAAPIFAALIAFAGYFIGAIAAALLRLPPKRRDTFALLVSFHNSTFLTIPIAFILFGEDGVLAVIMFSLGFNILYWTFAVWIFGRAENRKNGLSTLRNLANPAMLALLLGAVSGFYCVKLPEFFMDASKMLGNTTIPLAMLVVGAMLAQSRSQKGADFKEVFTLIFCKLILVPAIFLALVMHLKDIPLMMRSLIMLQACMPSASTSPLLAKQYGGDYNLASSGVFYTTLLSIVTVPLFMSIVMR